MDKLLKCKSPEERDVLKGKIEAEKDFQTILDSVKPGPERLNDIKAYLQRETSNDNLLSELLLETNERIENKIMARIKHFASLKKKFLKNPTKYA